MTDLHAHADRIAPALDSACPDPGAADMACIATTKADAIIRPWSHDMVSLATVRDRACAEATASRLMDIRSAFSLLEKRLGVDLAAEPATAPALRRIFSSVEPARLSISKKRLDNARSVIRSMIRTYGPPARRYTKPEDLAPAWRELIERVPDKRHAWGLSRLAAYASAFELAPEGVSVDTLAGFYQALVEEELVQQPRNVLKRTIALWNMQLKRVPGWPPTRLRTPFAREPKAWPLEAFPACFGADVREWERVMTHPDPFDLAAPAKGLRPATLDGVRLVIRGFASALVREGVVRREAMTELSVFFGGDNFRKGLMLFVEREDAGRVRETVRAHRTASCLIGIARHYLRLDHNRIAELSALVRRLDPKAPRMMGERSRRRLEQFDDVDVARRLLAFPEAHRRRALAKTGSLRRAQTFEQALAAALVIDTCLRIENLRTLRLDRHIRRTQDEILISVPAHEVKNGLPLELPVTGETAAMLDEFVSGFRKALPGAESTYLFPGKDGGPKCDGAMRTCLVNPIRRHTGIDITPHTFRHAIGKIIVDQDPALMAAVSLRLGHRNLQTTVTNYIGMQSRAAGRKLSTILTDVRDYAEQAGASNDRCRPVNSSRRRGRFDKQQSAAARPPLTSGLSGTMGADIAAKGSGKHR